MKTIRVFLVLYILLFSVALTSCGSSKSSNSSMPSSITITPPSPSIASNMTQQLTATGTYPDGTTKDITSSVTWTSSSTTVATINSSGLATGVKVGSTTITATIYGGINSMSKTTTLTITAAALSSIAITPVSVPILIAITQQFTATGTYSDGTTNDITSTTTWTSSSTSVATINSSGLATAVSAGSTTITATSGNISGTTTLTTVSAYSYKLANPNASSAATILYNYIASLPNNSTKRVISGQYAGCANPANNVYSATQSYPLYVTALKTATGKLVGLAGFDYYSDPAYFPPITSAGVLSTLNTSIINHWNQGGIVVVLFNPINPWTGNTGGDTNTKGHRLTDAITPGTAAYTNWIAQLDAVATALSQLQTAGVIVLWRPFAEMNGNWFWWGASAVAQDFIDVWQHMFNYLTNTKGLNNLIWVYAVSSGVNNPQNSVNTYYPGDNFVDIVAVNGYKNTIDAAITTSYNSLLINNKPFALSEYGPPTSVPGAGAFTGTFDFSTLITGIKNNIPKTCYFMIWGDCPTCNPKVYWSMVSNLNAGVLLSDPWIINANDLPSH